ncbi:MAG: InlB B-repeat-containing protein [Lachnospiraceae bacterium]|nr:InlB B-repeat-containing protein [Lachnospiraceae bacterium]
MATCNHKYEWVTTKEPTCTTAGKSEYKCSICGNVRDGREIAFLGHNMKEKSRVDSTCAKQGTITYECTRCKTTTKESIALKSHSYSWVTTKEPTCTEGGKSEKICSVCGRVADGKEIASLGGHDWVLKKTVDSTCAETGTKTYKCSRCSEKKTESIAKKDHKYSWVTTKDPTCTAGGKSEKVCSGCGRVADGKEIAALGHDMKYQSMVDSTCAKTGTKYYKCSRCTYTSTETIPMKDHTYSWVQTKDPTCTQGGKKENKCTGCGRVIDGVDIPFLGHNDVFQSKVDSTCAKTGTETYRCSRCGNISTKTIPVKEHTYSWKTTKEPTCTEGGKSEKICSGCGRSVDGKEIAALGHDPKLQSKVDSTCAKTGTETYKCSRCGNISTKTIALKDHTYSWKTTKEPTCTEGGKSERICSGCGRSVDGKEIAALGHDPKLQSKVDSTCAKTGTETYKCSRCGNISTKTIPLKEHTYSWKTTKEPTCTEGGKSEKICSGCGRSVDGKEIGALGHDPKLQSRVDSTCSKTGTETYKCSRCGDITTKALPLKPHTYSWKTVLEPGCTTPGKSEYKCDKCGHSSDGKEIAPLGHRNCKWTTVTKPTKTSVGKENYVCGYCKGVVKSRALYLISYDAHGGTNAPASQIKSEGVAVTLSTAVPTRSKYVFVGWGTTTNAATGYVAGYSFKEDKNVTFYAVWKPADCTVTYNLNGGTGTVPPTTTVTYGTTIVVPKASLSREGYWFLGWATSAKASEPQLTSKKGELTVKDNTTLYAVWSAKDVYINFDYNDGSGTIKSVLHKYGDEIIVGHILKRDGYSFNGWATSRTSKKADFVSTSTIKMGKRILLYTRYGVLDTIRYRSARMVE